MGERSPAHSVGPPRLVARGFVLATADGSVIGKPRLASTAIIARCDFAPPGLGDQSMDFMPFSNSRTVTTPVRALDAVAIRCQSSRLGLRPRPFNEMWDW